MENPKRATALAEALGGTEVQRGVKLGIIAASVELFLLFGGGILLRGQSNVFDPDRGQIAPLVVDLLSGFLALAIAIILTFYAGLSAPEAKNGETGRTGLLAGAITMLLFWIGQSIYALVNGAVSSQGLALGSYIQGRLITGVGFFVIGGLIGWWGSRASARRARSILSAPSSSTLSVLSALSGSAGSSAKFTNSDLSSQAIQANQDTPTASGDEDAEDRQWGSSLERERSSPSGDDEG
jgi:hypothetical protein